MMTTIKELFDRKQKLEAQISVYEEVLNLAYEAAGLKETYGHENVDAVLMQIDTVCLAPLRAELVSVDSVEVERAENKVEGKSQEDPAVKEVPKKRVARKKAGSGRRGRKPASGDTVQE